MDGVKVGLSLSPALDCHHAGSFQFGDQLGHARTCHAHILRQPILPRKAGIIVPGVAQKHRIGDFCANRDFRVFQNEIRDLGKASLQHGIEAVQSDNCEVRLDGACCLVVVSADRIGNVEVANVGDARFIPEGDGREPLRAWRERRNVSHFRVFLLNT